MNTTKSNTLSFYNEQGILTLIAKQFDTGRRFAFHIVDNDKPFDLSDCNAYLRIAKADGTQFQGHECCTIDGSAIMIDTSVGNGSQILTAAGTNICELYLENADGISLTTWTFNILVEPRVHDGSHITSVDSFDVLDIAERNEEIRQNQEAVRQNQETQRQGNETSRQENEENRKTKFEQFENRIAEITDEAKSYATNAKSWTVGGTNTRTGEDTDNSKHYYEQTKSIAESFSGTLRPKGTVAFAALPAISSAKEGDMYNISNQFTTTADFKEGSGRIIPAGANIYKTADGKWDVLAGTPVTGIKGDNESMYRQGNVNITAEDVGAISKKGDIMEGTLYLGNSEQKINSLNGNIVIQKEVKNGEDEDVETKRSRITLDENRMIISSSYYADSNSGGDFSQLFLNRSTAYIESGESDGDFSRGAKYSFTNSSFKAEGTDLQDGKLMDLGSTNQPWDTLYAKTSIFKNCPMNITNGSVSGLEKGETRIFSNGIAIGYNDNNDNCFSRSWMRHKDSSFVGNDLEIATGGIESDYNMPYENIVVRQYGKNNKILNEAYLLDRWGDTSFPGKIRMQHGADVCNIYSEGYTQDGGQFYHILGHAGQYRMQYLSFTPYTQYGTVHLPHSIRATHMPMIFGYVFSGKVPLHNSVLLHAYDITVGMFKIITSLTWDLVNLNNSTLIYGEECQRVCIMIIWEEKL